MIIGRAPGWAERFALSKASRRCSGSRFSIYPVAITELETLYSPHTGQEILTPSIVTSISSALAPQTRRFMCTRPVRPSITHISGHPTGKPLW